MSMKKNVGRFDAYIRITLGLVGLGCAISKMSNYRYGKKPYGLLLWSAMKVAEGITRFCPILLAFGISTRKEDLVRQAMDKIIPTGLSLYNKTREATSSMKNRALKRTSTDQQVHSENEQATDHNSQNTHVEELARKAFESFVESEKQSDQASQKQSTHQNSSHLDQSQNKNSSTHDAE
ncbi:DUF2892 domain-containing protein [Brevibacillus laterosporus]|uniref:DUF2892 domain-containing protein n=2 Tax=Brevibacillus laterosporus TaxID=1465 RepID=A0AAP8QA81_BRELA|nr:hypothetical protein BrL25_12345 [Brevibacillus laterosporus DSM 25]AYB40052.1 DUF2892 domain-containing protein [Brevibacillus laterosporus]MBM7108458.1 hypothetical protein [Brevibacillus laterosporus]NKQ21136.1 DUF2892 domain-containing protein [Brevibacillus laterosporus]PPA83892.1 DUF2892 domain-containing protein [Brevibacillus laterosporus]